MPSRNVRTVIILDAMSLFSSKIAPPLIQHGCFVLEDFGTMNGQWVRVQTLKKKSTKHDIACISHTIQSILELFLFDIAPNLLTVYTHPSEIILGKTSIERQMNRVSRDIKAYLMNTNSR